MFMLPTISRRPRKPQRQQVQLRPFGFFFQSHRGQWLLVPRSLPSLAHDADLLTLLLQILLVFAVFPLRHALVVMASFVLVAHPVRVTHVERLYPLGTAEVDHLARSLVPQVAHPPLLLPAFTLPCILQPSPALGACVTAGLQARELTKRLVVVPFDGAYASSGDNESFARAGRHRRLVNLT